MILPLLLFSFDHQGGMGDVGDDAEDGRDTLRKPLRFNILVEIRPDTVREVGLSIAHTGLLFRLLGNPVHGGFISGVNWRSRVQITSILIAEFADQYFSFCY